MAEKQAVDKTPVPKRSPEERLARKQAAGMKLPVEVLPEHLAMTVEELNALSDQLDAERNLLMARKRQVAAARAQLLAEEQADTWGLSVEEYARAKVEAREKGQPLHAVLNEARRRSRRAARQAQTVTAGVASTKAQVKGK